MMNMFLDNKYTKWYYHIVDRALNSPREGYVEKHHIIPKSLGGSNSKNNIVSLTAREHFICHWLLTKMVKNTKSKYQMWNAFSCMLYRKNDHQKRYKINSHMFENIKNQGSEIKSNYMSGKNNPMYGKTHSAESIEKIKQVHTGRIKSDNEIKNISSSLTGIKKSEMHKQRLKDAWERTRLSRSGENHALYGKNHSDQTREKIKKSLSKKCISPSGEIFDSTSDAAKKFNVTSNTIRNRIKSPNTAWCYINYEEKNNS